MLAIVQCVPRSQTRIIITMPRVNPGSEPVQPPHLGAAHAKRGAQDASESEDESSSRADGDADEAQKRGGHLAKRTGDSLTRVCEPCL